MAKPTSIFASSCLILFCMLTCTTYSSRRSNEEMNKIDSCWRSKPNWASNRQALADCAVGFGSGALGGKGGDIYVVTDPSDDALNPEPGTLRYGMIQTQPVWIIFQTDMNITLANELIVNSYKTIDGRGAKVTISNGPCITIDTVSHVIIHGISMYDCKPGRPGKVRVAPDRVLDRAGSAGDGITVYVSSNVWVDHCYLARCTDGLIDVTHTSTAVMLFGHSDTNVADRVIKVTVAFNHFGPGLVERMPRIRFGYTHVANNMYDAWQLYAIGGSASPTILSEGNYFYAPTGDDKEVTKRETADDWTAWTWKSSNDVFLNGAFFVQSGMGSCAPNYTASQGFVAAPGASVPALTSDAGPLNCFPARPCL